MLRFAICDDEPEAVKMISKIVRYIFNQLDETVEIKEYLSGNELRADIFGSEQFDVIFLDIDMPEINGINLGIQLRRHRYKSLLIYISNKDEAVFRSFQANPFRFIRKSKLREELPSVAKSILEELNKESSDFIILKVGTKDVKVNPYDIVYVESQRKEQYLHSVFSNYQTKKTFQELMEQLIPYGFIQIHKSYMVNYRFIKSINRMELELDNDQVLPISRQRITQVKKDFQNLSLS